MPVRLSNAMTSVSVEASLVDISAPQLFSVVTIRAVDVDTSNVSTLEIQRYSQYAMLIFKSQKL